MHTLSSDYSAALAVIVFLITIIISEFAFSLQARDVDGPTQGGGQVFYSIKSVNTDATVFDIDPITG